MNNELNYEELKEVVGGVGLPIKNINYYCGAPLDHKLTEADKGLKLVFVVKNFPFGFLLGKFSGISKDGYNYELNDVMTPISAYIGTLFSLRIDETVEIYYFKQRS